MDKYLAKTAKNKSPVYALLDMNTGLVRDIPKPDAPEPAPAPKRKETAEVTAPKKVHIEHEKVLKTQQYNGLVFGADGALQKVERPWLKYTKRQEGCNNASTCKEEAHHHDRDRTIIGQKEHRVPLPPTVEKMSPLAATDQSAKAKNLTLTTPFHDHHPFLFSTNVALPPDKECSEIVSPHEEQIRYEVLVHVDLRTAAGDLFHTCLKLMREHINAYHLCSAEKLHIQQQYDNIVEGVCAAAASPLKVRKEMAEVRDKRISHRQALFYDVANVLQESFDKKIEDIIERCVMVGLLRPSAQQVATRELFTYYNEFMKECSELKFLDKLVALLKREQIE